MNKEQQRTKAFEVLGLVDLLEHRNKFPAQLSGGQQQRTALARAIALSPGYLLLDEPLSALDAKVRSKLRLEIRRIQRELGITTIMVTHDQEEALTMADRIIVMNNAVIEQIGTPRTIYEKPANTFVANFIGTMNFYESDAGIFGVRPENIELAKNGLQESYWTGKVSFLEFKGAMIRVHSKLFDNREICVDLSVEKAKDLELKENDTVYLKIADRPSDSICRHKRGRLMVQHQGQKLKASNPAQLLLMLLLTCVFLIGMVFPLFSLFVKAFLNSNGDFAGFDNYIKYFSQPALSYSVVNTLNISLTTSIVSTALGLAYAYALQRTNIKLKQFFRYAALFPIFVPTVVHGIGLIVLFGKQGILTQMGMVFEIYGKTGIILSEIIYTFPQAFLMFYVTLHYADGRLYEAADSMGCNALTKFLRITLPEIKYTLINSLFVCFTLAFTDFGAPKVIGGSYNVLATDLYKQVAGQFDFNMGAVVSTLLLTPALLTFAADRVLNGKNFSEISTKAIELKIKDNKTRDSLFFAVCFLTCTFFLVMIGALAMDALMKYYPYERSLTLAHFVFSQSTGGIQSFVNSIIMSLLTAVFGTVFVFVYTYLIEKGKGMGQIKKLAKLLSVAPIALPGMVIGLSFIFFFNAKSNPLNFIYGTIVILVLANIVHFYSVPYVTASGALKKLDKEFESIAESMRIPGRMIFLKVSIPMSLPAILEIFMYYFVNAMVTVSAVVFLYSAGFKVASIAITHMEEAGDIAQASAMSLLILAVNLIVRSMYESYLYFNKKQSKKKGEVVYND